MPASISHNSTTYTFISLAGIMHRRQRAFEPLTRPGVAGTAVRELAERGRVFSMIGQADCDTLAAATTLHLALEDLQGRIVGPVVDDYGTSTPTLLVLEAEVLDKRKLLTASGGVSASKGALLIARFVFQKPTAAGV